MRFFNLKNRLIKKEKSDIDKKIAELKKTMFKKDEMSIAESLTKLTELASLNLNIVAEKFNKLAQSHNKFMDTISALLLRLNKGIYDEACIREVIDYCFRFGSKNVQNNGVLLLNMYKSMTGLTERYKLIFLKNKKANDFLQTKIYSKTETEE